MNTVIRKGNTYNVVKVPNVKPEAWTIRNVNHNTFFGEINVDGEHYEVKAIATPDSARVHRSLIATSKELAEWAVKALTSDIKPMR